VDTSAFLVMRRLAMRDAFAFDPHFAEQAFHCLPNAQ
jgi:predicted nucleic acid-binding protein